MTTPAEWLEHAREKERAGNFVEAEAILRRAVGEWPEDAELYARLATVTVRQGRLSDAESAFWRSLECQPDLGEALTGLAWILGERGELIASQHLYERALRSESGRVAIHAAIGLGHECSEAPKGTIRVEVSPGELLDKLSILEIKDERITDPVKRAHVRVEREVLEAVRRAAVERTPELDALEEQLKRVNERIWDVEDEIRACERQQDFGPRFIALARSVYHENDRRAAIKRAINDRLRSRLIEEKSYSSDAKPPTP